MEGFKECESLLRILEAKSKKLSSIEMITNDDLVELAQTILEKKVQILRLNSDSSSNSGSKNHEELKANIDTLLNIAETYDEEIPGESQKYSSKIGMDPQEDSLKNLFKYVTYHADAGSLFLYLEGVDVFLPNKFLKDGITLIDLPGTAISHRDDQIAIDVAKNSDVIIIITNSNQPLGQAEMSYLKDLYKLRNENLQYFLVIANMIDRALNHRGHEDNWRGRIKIMNGIARKLADQFSTTFLEPIAVSSFAVLKTLEQMESNSDNLKNDYITLTNAFLGYDYTDEDNGNLPEPVLPDYFLSECRPYPGGKTWEETKEKIYNYLVNNKGRIILENGVINLSRILEVTRKDIVSLLADLNENVNSIKSKINDLNKISYELINSKKNIREKIKSKDQPEFNHCARKICRNIEISVSEKIKNCDYSEKSLHNYLYDNTLKWIQIETSYELQNFNELDKILKNKQKEINQELLNFNISVGEYSKVLVGIKSDHLQLSVYEPEFKPGREEQRREVSDSVFYKPWTWFYSHYEINLEGRPPQWIYDNNQIKSHYRKEVQKIINNSSQTIEDYLLDYYNQNLGTMIQIYFDAIETFILNKQKDLEVALDILSKSTEEKNKREIYFNGQIDRIDQLNRELQKIQSRMSILNIKVNI